MKLSSFFFIIFSEYSRRKSPNNTFSRLFPVKKNKQNRFLQQLSEHRPRSKTRKGERFFVRIYFSWWGTCGERKPFCTSDLEFLAQEEERGSALYKNMQRQNQIRKQHVGQADPRICSYAVTLHSWWVYFCFCLGSFMSLSVHQIAGTRVNTTLCILKIFLAYIGWLLKEKKTPNISKN